MKDHKPNGFTLIETLVAMVVLAFGALSLAQMFTAGMWLNARAKDDTQLAVIAQTQLEKMISVGFDGLVDGGSLTTAVTDYSMVDDPATTDEDEGFHPESSDIVSDPSEYHQNAVHYDMYWEVTTAIKHDGTGSVDTAAGQALKEIAVRVVSRRRATISGLGSTIPAREITVRTQVVDQSF